MSDNKKINFSAQDNGVSSFMKKLMQDSKQLYGEFAKESEKQNKSQKETLKLIEAQINALKRQNQLEKEQNRIILERKRSAGLSDSKYKQGLSQINDDARVNSLQSGMLKDFLEQMKNDNKNNENKPGKEEPATKKQVFSAILAAGIVKDLLGLIKNTATAKTEFDLITPAATVAGTLGGAVAGSWTGYLSPGLPASVTQFGKEAGGFAGAGYTRHLMAQEEYFAGANRIRGLTGSRNRATDLSQIGLDRGAGSQLEESIVRAIQKGTTAEQIKNIAAISKAYTIDSNSIAQYLSSGRMGSSVNEGQIMGLRERGIDRAKLGTALQNVTQLIQLMGQTSLVPSSADALQKIEESNRIGGAFSVSDPRSLGFISTLQGNLTSPQSAFAQALSYSTLREQNPNGSIVDILKQRQEGGSKYERGVLERIASMTGSKDLSTLIYSSNFGTGNIGVDESRLAGRANIASGGSAITKTMSDAQMDQLYKEASSMTTTLQRSQAQVQNAFIIGFTDGIEKLATNFTDRMSEAVDKWVDSKLKPLLKQFNDTNGKKPNKNGQTY